MVDTTFVAAFFAGVLSFFAPCVLPVLPTYIAYVCGVSIHELRENGEQRYRKQILTASVFYVLGFSSVFTLLGVGAGGLGSVLRLYSSTLQAFGGLVIVVMGLQFGGFIQIEFLNRSRSISLPRVLSRFTYLHAFSLGVLFAIVWTPCIGAVLGSILALTVSLATAKTGAALLFTYSLGLTLPFLVVSMTLLSAPAYLRIVQRHVELISRISGLALVLIGVLLITGLYADLNSWLFDLAFSLGWSIK